MTESQALTGFKGVPLPIQGKGGPLWGRSETAKTSDSFLLTNIRERY